MAEDSFERFYTATYDRLLRQLSLVTGDRGDAEDLLQEAYGRASLRWGRLAELVRREMQGVYQLKVPLEVSMATGRSWAEAQH